jgi:hypothetical protein
VVYAGLALAIALALKPTMVSPALARPASDDLPAPKIAVCAVPQIVNDLMDSDRFKPDREEFERGLREELLTPLNEQLAAIQQEASTVDRSDQEAVRKLQNGELQREGARLQGEIARKVEEKIAQQLTESYGLVRDSATAVAEDLGFNYLLASSGPDDELETESVMALSRDLISRPVLMSPEGADITADVREDLKLK